MYEPQMYPAQQPRRSTGTRVAIGLAWTLLGVVLIAICLGVAFFYALGHSQWG